MARRRRPGRPKQAAAGDAHLRPVDKTGPFLCPVGRRSWSGVSRTPAIPGDGGHRRKVSVNVAAGVSPLARRVGFDLPTAADGSFDAARIVAFVRDLLEHLPGKVVVIWASGPNHGGPLARAFLKRNRRRVRLPPYCPHLSPVEAVWSWRKWGRRANDAPDTLADLDDRAAENLVELKCNQGLLRALWDRSELPFPAAAAGQPELPESQ